MSAATKFLFDADFSAPFRRDTAASSSAHQAAIPEAEARGYRAGFAAGEAAAREESAGALANACQRIALALEFALPKLDLNHATTENDAANVAVVVARKLAPALIAREPEPEIVALARACLTELRTAPHVVIRLHDSLQPSLVRVLSDIARERGFEGRLVVLGEAEIPPGDCRIEWADGGAVRDAGAVERTITELVARYMSARDTRLASRPEG